MQIMVNSDQLINASGKIKKLAGYMRINKRILAFVPITVFLIFTVLQGCGSSWQSKVKEQLPVLNSSYFIFYYPIEYDYELIVEKGLGNSKKKVK